MAQLRNKPEQSFRIVINDKMIDKTPAETGTMTPANGSTLSTFASFAPCTWSGANPDGSYSQNGSVIAKNAAAEIARYFIAFFHPET